ncbi:MAG: ATP-dependent DNA helicase [Clostridiales bacterium]|nr:ATP-dependent DNA helicase [Clostridiales bacterium]
MTRDFTPKNENTEPAMLLELADTIEVHKQKRNETGDGLPFPYSTFRRGQKTIINNVYRQITSQGRLFVKAPTGTGKTIAVLFPAIKALSRGFCKKIFYFTSKSTIAVSAMRAVEDMSKAGLKIKISAITARSKSCPYTITTDEMLKTQNLNSNEPFLQPDIFQSAKHKNFRPTKLAGDISNKDIQPETSLTGFSLTGAMPDRDSSVKVLSTNKSTSSTSSSEVSSARALLITACPESDCRLMKGYEKRLHAALTEIFASTKPLLDQKLIKSTASSHKLCPYEFSLDVALWSDVVVCDLNYLCDVRVYLRRFFEKPVPQNGRISEWKSSEAPPAEEKGYCFLIDEGHNLPDRGREMYSAITGRQIYMQLSSIMHRLQNSFHTKVNANEDPGNGKADTMEAYKIPLSETANETPDAIENEDMPQNLIDTDAMIKNIATKIIGICEQIIQYLNNLNDSCFGKRNDSRSRAVGIKNDKDSGIIVISSGSDHRIVEMDNESGRRMAGTGIVNASPREKIINPDALPGKPSTLFRKLSSNFGKLLKLLEESKSLPVFYRVRRQEIFSLYSHVSSFSTICTLAVRSSQNEISSSFQAATKSYYSGLYSAIVSTNPDAELRFFCADPSPLLEKAFDQAAASIIFSATLEPMEYYSRISGGGDKASFLHTPPPFPAENLLVYIDDMLNVRLQNRPDTYEHISNVLKKLIQSKAGNYIVYFPSYEYLEEVFFRFYSIATSLNTELQRQRPEMDERARTEFLEAFRQNAQNLSASLLAFAVLGGVFGEGIDLAGELLSGVVIVGVGLPGICAEREIITQYFERHEGDGFKYAYLLPGMGKVLQAAGRVIRTENDRGVVILLDDRYRDDTWKQYLPVSWMIVNKSDTPEDLSEILADFW